MVETPLDRAHAEMEAFGTEAARLAFYNRLVEAELFLLLASEAVSDQIEPEIFDAEDGRFVLVFDLEERLAEFVGDTAPYAALSGRAVVGLLAGRGVGLGLNLGVAPSSILLPDAAVDWLAETLATAPSEALEQPVEIRAPAGLPEILLSAIDGKLAAAAGLARLAYLVAVTYAPARPGHLLAVVGAVPGAEAALSRAIAEALAFSGLEAGEIDVGFFAASDPIAARLARVGLRFDIPQAEPQSSRPAPGMDPKRPPILR